MIIITIAKEYYETSIYAELVVFQAFTNTLISSFYLSFYYKQSIHVVNLNYRKQYGGEAFKKIFERISIVYVNCKEYNFLFLNI